MSPPYHRECEGPSRAPAPGAPRDSLLVRAAARPAPHTLVIMGLPLEVTADVMMGALLDVKAHVVMGALLDMKSHVMIGVA